MKKKLGIYRKELLAFTEKSSIKELHQKIINLEVLLESGEIPESLKPFMEERIEIYKEAIKRKNREAK